MTPGLHRLTELTRTEVAALREAGALAVLPLGATEQHGDHLPVGTDHVLAGEIAAEAARACTSLPVLLLPAMPFGLSPHHRLWPGTVTLSGATLIAVLKEVAASLAATGFTRMLIVNGHGGNVAPMSVAVTELCSAGFACGAVNYFAPAEPAWRPLLRGSFASVGHACEFETALVMALAGAEQAARIAARLPGLTPRLAQPYMADAEARDAVRAAGAAFAPVFAAEDCGYYGDPAVSTLATGEALRTVLVQALAAFYADFASAPLRTLPAA
jgi:creatinine amidohydrolase